MANILTFVASLRVWQVNMHIIDKLIFIITTLCLRLAIWQPPLKSLIIQKSVQHWVMTGLAQIWFFFKKNPRVVGFIGFFGFLDFRTICKVFFQFKMIFYFFL